MQIDVPAHRRDHLDNAIEGPHVGNTTEMSNKIEPATAKAALVQSAQFALAHSAVEIGNGPVGAATGGDGIERDAVVGAMHAGIDDHGAADAELGMQGPKIFQWRIGRRVGPIRRIGIFRVRPEDMAMRIAGQRRQLE